MENKKTIFEVISGIETDGSTRYLWRYFENDKWEQSFKWYHSETDCFMDFVCAFLK